MRTSEAELKNNLAPLKKMEFRLEHDPFEKVRHKGVGRWIFKHLGYKRNKYLILVWLLLMVVAGVLIAQIKIDLGRVIDDILQPSNSTEKYTILLSYFWKILGFGFIYPIITLISNFNREILAQRIERDVREEFYLNLLGKSQSFHDEQRLGDLMARATYDVRMLNFLISPAIGLLFNAGVNTIVPIIYIFINFPDQLLISPLVFVLIFIFALKGYIAKLGPVATQIQIEFGNLNAILNETLDGIEVVKGMALEKRALNKLDS